MWTGHRVLLYILCLPATPPARMCGTGAAGCHDSMAASRPVVRGPAGPSPHTAEGRVKPQTGSSGSGARIFSTAAALFPLGGPPATCPPAAPPAPCPESRRGRQPRQPPRRPGLSDSE